MMNKVIFVAIATLLITLFSSSIYETDATPLPFPSYTLAVGNLEFRIMYYTQLGSAKISQIELDQESNNLVVTLDRKQQTDDVLSLYLPRYLIESKVNGTDTRFNVLVNDETILNKQESNEMQHYLAIPLKPDTSTVKIIGTETLSITYDTTTLSLKDCCFWALTDKTVYFLGEEIIIQGSVAKKLPIEPAIYIFRNNELVSLVYIPEDQLTDEGFFSYSFGPAIQTGKYNLRMTYGSLSVKANFSIVDTGEFSANEGSIRTTPFTISFDERDFTKSARIHQILILKPNESKILHVKVQNNDQQAHIISLRISMLNVNVPFSHFFEQGRVLVSPNATKEVVLHIKAGNTNETHGSAIPLLAQSDIFGATAKTFVLFVGKNVTEHDMDWIDVSIRESLPGSAFANLDEKITQQGAEDILENKFATPKFFGTPRYLPEGYKFMGGEIGSPETLLVYAPVEITNMTETRDFWRAGGLMVFYNIIGANVNLKELLPDYIAFNEGQMVMINGVIGTAVEQKERATYEGYRFKFPAEITLFQGDSLVELRGNMPLAELLKVAASIPLKEIKSIPIIITELELNSQRYSATDVKAFACEGLHSISKQWIEIHNASDRVLSLQDIGIELYQGQTMQNSLFKQPLQPREYRVMELSSGLTFSTNRSFAVVRFGDFPLRIDSTPVLNDSMPTYKTWQKVGGQWIFQDPTPCSASVNDISQAAEDDSKYSPSGLLTVKVDKEVYSRTECVQVRGTVPAIISVPVVLQILEPNNAIYAQEQLSPKNDGTYSFDFNIGEDGITGTYTVRATYSNDVAWTEFSLVSGVLIEDEAIQIMSFTNGCFLSTEIDPDDKSLRLSVRTNATEYGELHVMLPRNLIDARNNGDDVDFAVLVAGEEADFHEINATLMSRTLVIPVDAGAKEIEIRGTHVIPEFPVNFIIITAIGLIGALIALRTKSGEIVI